MSSDDCCETRAPTHLEYQPNLMPLHFVETSVTQPFLRRTPAPNIKKISCQYASWRRLEPPCTLCISSTAHKGPPAELEDLFISLFAFRMLL